MLTGWGDDPYDDGEDDTENEPPVGTDGDVLGDVTASVRKQRKSSATLDKEEYWELDPGEFTTGQVSIPTMYLLPSYQGRSTVRPRSLRHSDNVCSCTQTG